MLPGIFIRFTSNFSRAVQQNYESNAMSGKKLPGMAELYPRSIHRLNRAGTACSVLRIRGPNVMISNWRARNCSSS